MDNVEYFEDVIMEDNRAFTSIHYHNPHNNSTHEAVNKEFPKIAEFYSKVTNPEQPTGKIAEPTTSKELEKVLSKINIC